MCLELGQIEHLRHAPLIINESGCDANTKTVSTSREELQDKLVFDGGKSPILMMQHGTDLFALDVHIGPKTGQTLQRPWPR